jgi:hypothetical protein
MQREPNQLSKRLLKGESAAFDQLYDLLGDKIYRYVYSDEVTLPAHYGNKYQGLTILDDIGMAWSQELSPEDQI